MAPIIWTDVTALPGAIGDGLTLVPVGGQTAILAAVNTFFDVSMFDGEDGPITHLARAYLSAHFCALGKLGTGGPLTGESDGRLSRQYAIPSTRSEYFATAYGRAVWQLMGPQARGPRVL